MLSTEVLDELDQCCVVWLYETGLYSAPFHRRRVTLKAGCGMSRIVPENVSSAAADRFSVAVPEAALASALPMVPVLLPARSGCLLLRFGHPNSNNHPR